ncbi:MAG: lysylphosphatidylglycerol synthase transmembrane domain-containing protein [Ktedonobacterales bacterium]
MSSPHDGLQKPAPSSAATSVGAGAVRVNRLLSRVSELFRRYKTLVTVVVLALIAVFLGTGVWSSWSTLSHYHWEVRWWLFVAAFLLLVTQELSYAFIWRGILARLGSRLDIVSSQRIYLGAEFVRYIPGNVWHVITRVLWAEQRGVPKSVGFASMVVELATKITGAALIFVLSLFFWPSVGALTTRLNIPHELLASAAAIAVPLLLGGLYPPILQATLNFILRKLGREPIRITLHYGDILLITAFWMMSWLVAGAGFYLLIESIANIPVSPAGLAVAIGIYAIGWDVGFLSFVTPSGLGFREAAIIVLLTASNLVPSVAIATVLAFVARLLATASELLCITIAHIAPGAPAPPQADLVKHAQTELP